MGHADQAVAGIVKIDCGGTNFIGYGVSFLLQVREKTGPVTVRELVKGFQEGR